MKERSPFNPNFGKVPQLFLDRERIISDYVDELTNAGTEIDTPYQTTMICGVRGSGKTSVLTGIIDQIEQHDDWVVVDLLNNQLIIDNLIENLQMQPELKLKSFFSKVDKIKTRHFDFKLVAGNATQIGLLMEIFKHLKAHHKKVLIAIDEVSSTPQIRDLAMIYQQLIRQRFGVALVMTGLPENISELQHNKVLTFLLRSNQLELPFLHGKSIEQAFRTNFAQGGRRISDEIATRLTLMTRGYAYAFQLLGYLVWKSTAPGDEISADVVNQVVNEYQDTLARKAYALVYQQLTAGDKEFLRAMAMSESEDGQVKMAAIARQTGKPSNYWSTYRKRLIKQQIIKDEAYAYVAFKLPYFKDFVLEEQRIEKYDF